MFWVYIMASRPRGTLYVGSTADMARRAREHRGGSGSAFTRKYAVGRLVWYREYDTEVEAKQRERTMKEWPRGWKMKIIEAENPEWRDLWPLLLRTRVERSDHADREMDPGNKSRGCDPAGSLHRRAQDG
jgi:putative endonuclease